MVTNVTPALRPQLSAGVRPAGHAAQINCVPCCATMSSLLMRMTSTNEAERENISSSSCYMDRYSSVDQGRALSTTFKVLSDEAQNIIAAYESALFAKSSPHVECRTESKFNIC